MHTVFSSLGTTDTLIAHVPYPTQRAMSRLTNRMIARQFIMEASIRYEKQLCLISLESCYLMDVVPMHRTALHGGDYIRVN